MNEVETKDCPECGSEQPGEVPFCQNCGFRIRPAETVREAIGPLQREKLDEILPREPRIDDPDSDEVIEAVSSRPARQMMAITEELEEEGRETSTLVEGVKAVQAEAAASASADEAVENDTDEVYASATAKTREKSPAPAVAPVAPRDNTKFIVWSALLLCVAGVAMLSWFHHSQRAQATLEASAAVGEEPHRIEIQEGAFRRGLSDELQSFILQLCQRLDEEPGKNCDRDRLLRGEYPQQTVRMPAFSIDSGPVRNMDYQDCVMAGSCDPVAYENCDIWTPGGLQIGVRMPRVLKRAERPVVCVNRRRAEQYCQWRGGKLPTHNQWEKAARGEEGPLFPWGDFWEADRANWGERDMLRTAVPGKLDGFAWTSPPGVFVNGRSPYGLDDMAGNVAEWVRGDDELEGHVRGGSWISNPFELRTTARVPRNAGVQRTDIGFRCVY